MFVTLPSHSHCWAEDKGKAQYVFFKRRTTPFACTTKGESLLNSIFSVNPISTWVFLTYCTKWPQKLKRHFIFQTSWSDIGGVSTNQKLVNGQTANERKLRKLAPGLAGIPSDIEDCRMQFQYSVLRVTGELYDDLILI